MSKGEIEMERVELWEAGWGEWNHVTGWEAKEPREEELGPEGSWRRLSV